MSGNPIQMTSRTFLTALNDINSDAALIDKPDWFKRLISGVIDVASFLINAEANNGYLRTALTQRAVTDLAALIDYVPPQNIAASGTEMFDASPAATMPFTVNQADVAANGPSGIGNSALRYGARSSLTFSQLIESLLPAAFNVSSGQITVAASPGRYVVGEKVRLSSTLTLPTGLFVNTDYYVSSVNLVTPSITLATTRSLAVAGSIIIPSTQGTGVISMTRLSQAATLYQEIDVAAYAIGSSDGTTSWQEFDIPQVDVLSGTLVVTDSSAQQYTQLQTLALSASSDKVYRLYFNTDGTATIRFGNGSYGAIPPAGPIYISYSYGGGSTSNVSSVNQVVGYAGGNANISGCFNSTAFTGGADPEAMSVTKINAPMLLKSRSRFITPGDGVALAMSQGGLSLVVVNKNVYGVLSVQVVGVAMGGGSPSSATRSAIAAYLAGLSPMQDITVLFDAGTFTPLTISLNIHIIPGYYFSAITPYILISAGMFFSEAGAQVLNDLSNGGISAAVADINTIFGMSFSASDYAVISAILAMLNTVSARSFGDLVELSGLYAMVESIPGVGYTIATACSLTNFLSTGYQCSASEILSVNKSLASAITLASV